MPILSTDGSRLSGLEVDGTVYDVSFKDGVLSELFPVSLVQSPGWYELANSMIAAIADALAAIDPLPQHTDINGCEDGPGLPGFVGPGVCIIGIPDTMSASATPAWEFDSFVAVNTPQQLVADAPNTLTPGGIFGEFDSAVDFAHFTTFAVFTAVPAPATIVLICIGLVATRLHRVKR